MIPMTPPYEILKQPNKLKFAQQRKLFTPLGGYDILSKTERGRSMGLQFRKGDIFAIGLVIVLALVVGLLFLPKPAEGAAVEIYQDGQLVKTIPLSAQEAFTLSGDYTNVIRVADGQVAIISSDCPGMDCVHSGAISVPGRSLVCLPNGVEVRIVGKTGDVDFVVG